MKEEILKLDEMIDQLQKFTDYVFTSYKSLTREVVLTGMIVKKTMDILDTAKYTLKNYIISTQISLLRLLCDNCLALQSVKELGIEKYLDMLTNHVKVNTIMIDDEQNMSDGYLKKRVAISYPGFDRLYNLLVRVFIFLLKHLEVHLVKMMMELFLVIFVLEIRS